MSRLSEGRRRTRTLVVVALIALTLVVLVSCTTVQQVLDQIQSEESIEALRAEELDLVRSTIAEADRERLFIELLAERDLLMDRYAEQVKTHREIIAGLNADYSSSRQDFETQLDSFNRLRADAQLELIDLITRMKQVTTADEWDAIATFQTRKLAPRKMAFGERTGGD